MYTLKVIRNGKTVDIVMRKHVETLMMILNEDIISTLKVYGNKTERDWKFVIQKNKKRGAK